MEQWRAKLEAGDSEAAWELFIARYRGLIVSVVRRTLDSDEDAEDVVAEACAILSSDKLNRLARHSDSGKARFSTWLVTVVQRIAIDWIRHRDGRRRVTTPEGLSRIQNEIFDALIRRRCSHVEAYELIRQRLSGDLPFAKFMNEVRATFTRLEEMSGKTVAHYFPGPPAQIEQAGLDPDDAAVMNESAAKVNAAMQRLEPDERLAVHLFVIDELPAADVAKIVGWPNAKAVYNRVSRALSGLRRELSQLGVEP